MTDVVFISRQRIVGRTNGSSTYLIDLARSVRDAGMTPHLLQPSPTMMGRMPVLRLGAELSVFATHRVRGVLKLGNVIVSRDWRVYTAIAGAGVKAVARRLKVPGAWTADRPAAYAIAIPWTEADRRFVARATRSGVDAAIADYMFQAEAFDAIAAAPVPTAIVMHDLFSARDGGARDSVAVVDRASELAMLARADRVIAIQPQEADFVDSQLGARRAILAPMAAHPVAASQPGDGDRLFFVGSNTAPNIVGLKWFFAEVWPSVRAAWPLASLEVAGTVARAFPDGGPAGVHFLGLVDDLDALYRDVGIVISPLTFGSGLKVKLVEALAAGKAIVATSVTLQGVKHECADAIAHEDTPAGFSAAILKLHRDLSYREMLAEAALEVARRYFSPCACYGPFITWLKEATKEQDIAGADKGSKAVGQLPSG